MRLFCFPFAGGGAATFRPWVQHLDPRVELVAIEPPGRQTRIDESPIRDLETFVQQLVPRLLPFLDKPFAVYGHCLGALTLFETVRTLMRAHGLAPVHVFVSGARPPDELHRSQDFETTLLEKLLKLPGYSLFAPIHQQPDEVFAAAMLEFNVIATESLLDDPELRRLIMPVIRAEFEMSSKYRYVPEEPWDVAITCLTGTRDLYVTAANARSWSRFTKRRFQLLLVDTEHFLVVDEDELVLRVLNRELAHPL
jgi:epothilone polyketide synthase C